VGNEPVMVSPGEFTVRVRDPAAVVELLSVTCTVNENEPTAPGVPMIAPEESPSPGGSVVPAARDQV
jgi:hypothetical protein